jgi:lipopolysaccharide biosynthesis glycosyltransferase
MGRRRSSGTSTRHAPDGNRWVSRVRQSHSSLTTSGTRMTRVAMAADDGYARTLAAAGRSLIRHLGGGRELELYVLDMWISSENRDKLAASFDHPRTRLFFSTEAKQAVAGLPTYAWFTTAAYARLLLPDVLPASADRVLYLDCDVVVRRCVGELFDMPMSGAIALAVPDMGAAFVACRFGVGGWFDAGRSAADLNFNTGVMVMDLVAWRHERIGTTAIEYARQYARTRDGQGDYRLNVDQEALNATAGRRMLAVDPRWNQQGWLFHASNEAVLPYSRETLRQVRRDPYIVHFSTAAKPWIYGCKHPSVAEWFENLDHTEYRGWRPSAPTRVQRLARRARSALSVVARRLGLT